MLLKTNPAAKLRRLCAQYVHNAIYFTPPSVKNDERPGRRQCAPQAAAARPAAASGQQPEPQPLARMPPFAALSAAFRGLESRVLAGSFQQTSFQQTSRQGTSLIGLIRLIRSNEPDKPNEPNEPDKPNKPNKACLLVC